ncbi:MmgE/PrpD family protein [Tabrizicola sp. WMC-M-20]|nr:MmgE/PrpD family protein [Tabrizicola sp. WMC-M-20]
MPPIATLAEGLVDQALQATLHDMSPAAVAKAKLCLMDYLACALEARALPWAQQAAAMATPATTGAALIGRGLRSSPQEAAFANAVAGHGLVREDMHAGSIAHLGVVIWPVLLALAARDRVSGAGLLAAAIVGYEVGARLGRAVMTADLARLFRPTGLVGAPAAVVAACHLTGAGREQAVSALSLAINTCGGLNQWPHSGSDEMYFHPGFAARNAIQCHDLARAGARASTDILEGEAGFFAAFARTRRQEPIVLFPNCQSDIDTVFLKEAPACNFAQTPCQAALRAGHQVRSGIRAVEIWVTEAALRYPGCDATGPFRTPLQAKMSIPFGVAATLARGVIAEANYADAANPEILRLIAATTMRADPALTAAFPARQGAAVTLYLDDGGQVCAELADVLPATEALVHARFTAAATAALGAAATARLTRIIEQLERETDAGHLDTLCVVEADARPRLQEERMAMIQGTERPEAQA